ncbi:3-hydroxyacyl-CoA dehydrogenase family protein [Tenacibaculum tangerinum]|uniref:3-hydroxyacyl-CoA dehydrogenase family protein n=1 Tax=Tenacibaculum tangerinum TaxID=3038772 RepID=A0ABY8KYB7_9FLAO|nr:3-hydroxyacyl-CoA dehydrogenase family protein [Tenacibaculum tangerinum]WGH74232.1 3-hydroxyacyl-CoA dehydrogenase family protein [Tenacibaculum tangerinum]
MSVNITIMGAGVMGTGVAHNFAQYGIPVTLIDISEKQLENSEKQIRKNLRLYKFHKNHYKSKESVDEIIERINFTTNYSEAKDADLIIENVTEDWDIKKEVYKKLRNICKEDAKWAVNTSAVSITKVANLLPKPENVIGVHFMNPVPLKPMVELIKGYHTNNETVAFLQDQMSVLNKRTLVVNDSPGFVTNRAMMIFVNEAVFMLQEGVASAKDIDTLFKECFGHTMGPLETADLIGLDTILKSLYMLQDGFNDDKFRPCFLLKKMVNANLLGMKSGEGFYSYNV